MLQSSMDGHGLYELIPNLLKTGVCEGIGLKASPDVAQPMSFYTHPIIVRSGVAVTIDFSFWLPDFWVQG